MFRVLYVCIILIPLVASECSNCKGRPDIKKEGMQPFDMQILHSCENLIKLRPFFKSANLVTTRFTKCNETLRKIEVPSLSGDKIGSSAVVFNTQWTLPVTIVSERDTKIVDVPPQYMAVLVYENGWDFISESETYNTIKDELRVWSINNWTMYQNDYFGWTPKYDYKDIFKTEQASFVEVQPDNKLNAFYLPPTPSTGEDHIVRFANKSPSGVYIGLKYKRFIRVEPGKVVYLKNFNGWRSVLEKLVYKYDPDA